MKTNARQNPVARTHRSDAIQVPPPPRPCANRQPSTFNLQPSTIALPRYALRKGLGCWELTFEGRRAVLKHEQGILYVAWLLLNPPEAPIHGLALALKARAAWPEPLEGGATIEQRNLGLDDAEAMSALRRKQRQLEAQLEDDLISEPVKAEIRTELEEVCEFQSRNSWRARDSAQKCVRTVTMAIKRFYGHLAGAVDAHGAPHPVLRPFARHIRDHLLVPSGRAGGHGGFRAREGLAGCFTYEPPADVAWIA